MRVANLNWNNPCPDGFKQRNDSDIRTRGIGSTSTGSCSSKHTALHIVESVAR